MKLITKRFLSLVLALTLAFSMYAPSVHAISTAFSIREVFGNFSGQVYTVTKSGGALLRREPHNGGGQITMLPENYPIIVDGMFTTSKGTQWFRIKAEDVPLDCAYYDVGWIYAGNVTEHHHDYRQFETFNYQFCIECGHLQRVGVQKTLSESLDDLQLTLAIYSMIPAGVGNCFDVLSGLLSLLRGDLVGAALDFASAIPILGLGGNAVRIGDVIQVNHRAGKFLYAVDHVDGVISVRPARNTYRLRTHMDRMFVETGLPRFNKNIGNGVDVVDAHHIVAIEARAAEPAREILFKLGIDPNGASNGSYICRTSEICGTTLHKYLHSSKYYESVNRRIEGAFNSSFNWQKQREAVLIELDRIASDLVAGRPI